MRGANPRLLYQIFGKEVVSMIYPAIETYMIKRNLSLRHFAEKCGIPSSVMCRTLNGKTDPTKSTIDKILSETGMNYEQCFGENK